MATAHAGKDAALQLAPISSISIPTTISPEAQAFLKKRYVSSGKIPPTPRSVEEWKARQERYRQVYGRADLQNALQQSQPFNIEKQTIAEVTVRTIRPAAIAAQNQDRVLIQLHGGGYVYGDGDMTVIGAIPIALRSQIKVISVDYRMPPEAPFPAAVEDVVAVYRELIQRYRPENIGIFGSSAGGGLTAAVTLAIRDQGLPLPSAVALITPWSDLSKSGDSYETLAELDPVLRSYEAGLADFATLYAGDTDLKKPLVSPVYGDYSKGFPPALLLTGTRDLFLSCTVRLHRKLRQAGQPAELHVFEGMWHGFHGNNKLPEAQDALNEIADFFKRHLGQPRS